jgi:hypothetical protein
MAKGASEPAHRWAAIMSGVVCQCGVREPGTGRLVARRIGKATGALLPGLALALMPKCPACFAAYFALGTGIGLSFSQAAWVRVALIVLCGAAACYSLARCVRWLVNLVRARTEQTIGGV